MKQQRKQVVDSHVLAFWRARSAVLGRMLDEAPAGEQSWLWKIQSDIINYLMDRYGGDPLQPAPAPPAGEATPIPADVMNSPVPEVRPSSSFISDAGEGKLPRAAGKLRPVLHEIAGNNHSRYETIQRQQEEDRERAHIDFQRMLDALPRSEPVDRSTGKVDEGQTPYARSLNWTSKNKPANASLGPIVEEPEMPGVSDDEIAGIRSGEIVVEAVPENALDVPAEESNPHDAS